MRRLACILSLALLLAPLVAPQALSLFRIDQGPSGVEKCAQAPPPTLALAATDPGACAATANRWYRENFPFRAAMIRMGNLARLRLFGESPSPSVLLGKEGWLFAKTESGLDDWLGVGLYPPDELIRNVAVLAARRDWLAERGVALLVAIAPNKSTIHPEMLPDSLHQIGRTTRLDQLVPALEAAGVEVLDLRKPLAEAKRTRRVYHKTDTHWNDAGALVACAAIVERLRTRFPALPPLSLDRFAFRERIAPGGDLAEMLYLERELPETVFEAIPLDPRRAKPAGPRGYRNPAVLSDRDLVVRELDDPTLPAAVVFRDSFSSAAWPFLAERFRRSIFVWEHRFQPHIVLAEKPDVVIYEVVERYQRALFFE